MLVNGIIKRTNKTKYDNDLFKITCFYARQSLSNDLIIKFTVDEILEEAIVQKYKYCLISNTGHVILSPKIKNQIITIIKNIDFFIMGHILDKKEEYYSLHEQFLLVNLHYYKLLGKPKFTKNINKINLQVPYRSKINIHDDYTPIWLKKDKKSLSKIYNKTHPGWEFINKSLENNIPVLNWPAGIRQKKLYMYPNDNIKDVLYDFIINNYNNKKFIYIWNTESYMALHRINKTKPLEPLEYFYGVAAGLKSNVILKSFTFTDSTIVNYFDYSTDALLFKKYLLETWNGKDYINFTIKAKEYLEFKYSDATAELSMSEQLTQMLSALEFWNNKDSKFIEDWEKYKKLQHTYTECDIINNPDKLLDIIDKKSKHSLIWWSNAFHTSYSFFIYDFKKQGLLREKYTYWIDSLKKINPELILYGKDFLNNNIDCVRAKDYVIPE